MELLERLEPVLIFLAGGLLGWFGPWISARSLSKSQREATQEARRWEQITRDRALAAEASALLHRITDIGTLLSEGDEEAVKVAVRDAARVLDLLEELALFAWHNAIRQAAQDLVKVLTEIKWKVERDGATEYLINLAEPHRSFRKACLVAVATTASMRSI